MTRAEQDKVRNLRQGGCSYAEVSAATGLKVGTIKSYCSRQGIVPEKATHDGRCANCGFVLQQAQHRQTKRFCSSRCRSLWWAKNRHRRVRRGQTHICVRCGKAYPSYDAQSKFCSHPCYIASRFGKGGSSV